MQPWWTYHLMDPKLLSFFNFAGHLEKSAFFGITGINFFKKQNKINISLIHLFDIIDILKHGQMKALSISHKEVFISHMTCNGQMIPHRPETWWEFYVIPLEIFQRICLLWKLSFSARFCLQDFVNIVQVNHCVKISDELNCVLWHSSINQINQVTYI